jgi:hypothetical protein
MAEIELAVLAGQCLDRRLADRASLERAVAAWEAIRNATGRGVDWRFTTQDARVKLKHLYPLIQVWQSYPLARGEPQQTLPTSG